MLMLCVYTCLHYTGAIFKERVLNCKTVSTVEEQEPKSKRVCLKQEDSQENFMPTISITGGTNITINIKQ